jgi:hypothetical protein
MRQAHEVKKVMVWFSWGTDEFGKSYFRIYGIKVTLKRLAVLAVLVTVVGVGGALTKKAPTSAGGRHVDTGCTVAYPVARGGYCYTR